MDIRAEFVRYCGPSVLFIGSNNSGRTIKIEYTIPALAPDIRFVVGHLPNGLERTLSRVVRRAADSARLDAYRRTGHHEADLARLLSGRTI